MKNNDVRYELRVSLWTVARDVHILVMSWKATRLLYKRSPPFAGKGVQVESG